MGILCLSALAGCGDSGGGTEPPPVKDTRPHSLVIVDGDGQTGTVATVLDDSLVVKVTNEAGATLSDVSVEWSVASGGGSLSPATSRTDGNGLARTAWTLGTAVGSGEVTAKVANLPPVAFTAEAEHGEAATLVATPAEIVFEAIGDTAHLGAAVEDAYGNPIPDPTISWASLDTTVATVSAGVIEAVGNGTTSVIATSGEGADTVAVRVQVSAAEDPPGEDPPGEDPPGEDPPGENPPGEDPPGEELPVVTVRIEAERDTLNAIGATLQLTAVPLDENGDEVAGATVTWTSLTPELASIDEIGLLISLAVGAAVVEAAADGVADTASIVIRQVPASVAVTPDSVTVLVGDTIHFTAEAADSNGVPIPMPDFDWSTSDSTTATVDTEGVVTAVAAGTSTLTAKAGEASGTATIQVRGSLPVAIGDTVVGALETPDQIRRFTFTGTAGQELNIFFQVLSGTDRELELELYGPNDLPTGAAVTAHSKDRNRPFRLFDTDRFEIEESGSYTIEIRDTDAAAPGDEVSYRFEIVEIDRAPEALPSGAIQLGDVVSGEAIDFQGDIDEFTFEVGPSGAMVNVFLRVLQASTSNALNWTELTVYGPGGAKVVPVFRVGGADWADTLRTYAAGRYTLQDPGTYTIRVEGGETALMSGTAAYEFELFEIDPAPESTSGMIVPTDTLLGNPFHRREGESIDVLGDVDEFTFDAQAGKKVRVILQNESADTSKVFRVEIIEPDGSLVASTLSNTVNAVMGDTGEVTMPETGTYTLRVSGFHSTTRGDLGEYAVQVVWEP